MTATGRPRHEWSTGRQGFALPWANRFKSGLLDIPPYRSIYIYYELRTTVCRWSRYHNKKGAYRRWRTYPAIYRDFVEVRQSEGGDTPPHRSIAINLEPGKNLPFGRIYNFSELSGAIFTQLCGLRSRAQEARSWICI
jgi:hypothetical protein